MLRASSAASSSSDLLYLNPGIWPVLHVLVFSLPGDGLSATVCHPRLCNTSILQDRASAASNGKEGSRPNSSAALRFMLLMVDHPVFKPRCRLCLNFDCLQRDSSDHLPAQYCFQSGALWRRGPSRALRNQQDQCCLVYWMPTQQCSALRDCEVFRYGEQSW